MRKASIEELYLTHLPVEFMGFTPKYFVMDTDGVQWICHNEPKFDGYDWVFQEFYEIGIDDEDLKHTPKCVIGLSPQECIFEIEGSDRIIDTTSGEYNSVQWPHLQ